MAEITIVGLGPGGYEQLTIEALESLTGAREVWVRTRQHPVVQALAARVTIRSFDDVYEESARFEEVYDRIADRVIELGQRAQGVVYGVPGHPFVGESTVQKVIALAEAAGIPVRMVEGLSFIEPSLAAARGDALDGLQIADATTFSARYYPPFDGDRPVLIAQLFSRAVASETKLLLMELYPDDHPVTLIQGEGETATIPLHALDQRETFGLRTSLWVPPLRTQGALHYFQDIIAHLRAPDGCPWDREQDFTTLRNSILEEAYEVVDAIERGDMAGLREELGDQLLLVTMYSQMASEEGLFTLHEVISGVSAKIIRRHPHVWTGVEVSGTADVLANWDAIKAQEKAGAQEPRDVYDEVPLGMPALLRAEKIAKRARKAGGALPEPQAAFTAWQAEPENGKLLGELLLAVANVANEKGLESESVLRAATDRLISRIRDA